MAGKDGTKLFAGNTIGRFGLGSDGLKFCVQTANVVDVETCCVGKFGSEAGSCSSGSRGSRW